MSDLTDGLIVEWLDVIDRNPPTINQSLTLKTLRRALLELQRHRSALAPDRERVLSVVASEVHDSLEYHHNSGGQWVPMDFERLADAIAARAAEQLATAALPLWAKLAIQRLHEQVDQTDPNDPIGIALTRAGLDVRVDRASIDYDDRLALLSLLHGDRLTDEQSTALARALGVSRDR